MAKFGSPYQEHRLRVPGQDGSASLRQVGLPVSRSARREGSSLHGAAAIAVAGLRSVVVDFSTDPRLKRSFINIVDQCPSQSFGRERTFKLLVVENDVYLLLVQGARCTVFTLYPESFPTLPHVEHGCSAFEYLCTVLVPTPGQKDHRFNFDLNRRWPQGARNFAQRVSQRFNIGEAWTLFHRLGGRT